MSAQPTHIQPVSRRSRHRVRIIAASIVAAAAASVPLTAHGASSNATPRDQAVHEMHQLEARGYVPTLCTRTGTMMVNPNGRRVVVKLAWA
jgi:hypothetical protein